MRQITLLCAFQLVSLAGAQTFPADFTKWNVVPNGCTTAITKNTVRVIQGAKAWASCSVFVTVQFPASGHYRLSTWHSSAFKHREELWIAMGNRSWHYANKTNRLQQLTPFVSAGKSTVGFTWASRTTLGGSAIFRLPRIERVRLPNCSMRVHEWSAGSESVTIDITGLTKQSPRLLFWSPSLLPRAIKIPNVLGALELGAPLHVITSVKPGENLWLRSNIQLRRVLAGYWQVLELPQGKLHLGSSNHVVFN